ncbi:glycosyltransferase family 2 protein [Candidatus Shapirobacteria bacterium]|nr:glycosyltransferase family 2 protein [Candidatus Shapirobacteria bacterium]
MKQTLTAIIISGNFQDVISRCLNSVAFADEIVVVLANSTDNTSKIIKDNYPQVKTTIVTDEYNKKFSNWRNAGYKMATSNWIFYVDTDEVVTPNLAKEIISTINQPEHDSYYVVPRANHFLGQRVRHGGSYPDYVKRLFYTKNFKGFTGDVHEEPVVTGNMGYLKNDLQHFTHTDLQSMLQKSLVWTDTEAKLLFQANHPPVVWWRFPRMMLTKFWERMIKEKMFLDGTVGVISVIFEMFNTFMIYARLWELQQKKGI